MRKLSWIAQSGDLLLINSKRLRQQREVVGGKEAEKRNKSFPSSSHCRLTFPILNTTHLSRRFDKFTSMEIKLKTTIAKFSFMKSKGTKSIENRKNKKQKLNKKTRRNLRGKLYENKRSCQVPFVFSPHSG